MTDRVDVSARLVHRNRGDDANADDPTNTNACELRHTTQESPP